jgi:hypothetical protein
MSMRFWALPAVFERRLTKLFQPAYRAVLLLGALIAVAGCAAPLQPSAGPDPSDPSVRVPPAGYRSTLGAYRSQRPVEPGDWKDINERITPQPKPGE